MLSECRRLLSVGLLTMACGVAAAGEQGDVPLVTVENYGDSPLEFAIGEQAFITVSYRHDIDPERVHVRMNGRVVEQMLNPEPGESETVPLYLENGENHLVIEAGSTDFPPDEGPEKQFEYGFVETLKPRYGSRGGPPTDGEFF